MKIFFPLFFILLLISCATAPPLQTPSGSPEVFLPNMSGERMMQGLTAAIGQSGGIIEQTSLNHIIWSAPITDPLQMGLFGTNAKYSISYQSLKKEGESGSLLLNGW